MKYIEKFKSIVLVLIIAAVCAAGMTGCGQSGQKTDSSGSAGSTANSSTNSTENSKENSGAKSDTAAQAEQIREALDIKSDSPLGKLSDEELIEAIMPQTVKEFSADELLSGKHHAVISIKGKGDIELELDADEAPISVTNFIDLAKSGFYNGLTFHRVLTGSLIQGGALTPQGYGGPGYSIKGEFSANGVENHLSHTRGAISMARSSNFDGGSAQFFIMSSDSTPYDGQYAAFGYVTSGMDIVDDICNNTPVQDFNGTVAAADQPVIESVRVID